MFKNPCAKKLKLEREQHAWSQEQVAAMIGTTAANVSRWERGITFPGLHFRQKLCELFGKSLDELGLFAATSPERDLSLTKEKASVLSSAAKNNFTLWGLPHHRNPLFIGRESELQKVHDTLQACRGAAIVINGLPGIGKTQLGIEYAYRHFSEYTAVFWIEAENAETMLSSFLAIAELLHLPERQETDQQRIVAAVQRWLNEHEKWLLIWDNLVDLETFQRSLPTARQGASLITTRRQASGSLALDLKLSPLEQVEGMLLLLRRAKVLNAKAMSKQLEQFAERMSTEHRAARDLVDTLGRLPLALDQAGAYIEETGCSVSGYLECYGQQRERLLSRRGIPAYDHPHSVATTFRLSYQQLERDHVGALAILRLSAFLHAETIPEEIFVTSTPYLKSVSEKIPADPYQLDQAFAALRNLSLIQRYPETKTLTIHCLMQTLLREEMTEQERRQWQQRAIHLLNALFPRVNHDTWGLCERFLPHTLACAATIPELAGELEDLALAELLLKAAEYLYERAQYEQAEPLFHRALRIFEQVAEPEHPHVTVSSRLGVNINFKREIFS